MKVSMDPIIIQDSRLCLHSTFNLELSRYKEDDKTPSSPGITPLLNDSTIIPKLPHFEIIFKIHWKNADCNDYNDIFEILGHLIQKGQFWEDLGYEASLKLGTQNAYSFKVMLICHLISDTKLDSLLESQEVALPHDKKRIKVTEGANLDLKQHILSLNKLTVDLLFDIKKTEKYYKRDLLLSTASLINKAFGSLILNKFEQLMPLVFSFEARRRFEFSYPYIPTISSILKQYGDNTNDNNNPLLFFNFVSVSKKHFPSMERLKQIAQNPERKRYLMNKIKKNGYNTEKTLNLAHFGSICNTELLLNNDNKELFFSNEDDDSNNYKESVFDSQNDDTLYNVQISSENVLEGGSMNNNDDTLCNIDISSEDVLEGGSININDDMLCNVDISSEDVLDLENVIDNDELHCERSD